MSDLKEAVKAAKKQGVEVTGLPKVGGKLPTKKLGSLADQLHAIREVRLAVAKVADQLKAEETRLTEHIINTLDTEAEGGVVGKRYKAIVRRESIPIVEDWEAVYGYIKDNDAFDLLNKQVNRAAVRERWENEEAVPGLGSFQAKKLSLTKV